MTARLELRQPQAGLGQVRIGDCKIDGNLLQVLLPPSIRDSGDSPQTLEDRFTRGDDLVATYRTGRTQACRYELAWRVLAGNADHHWLGGVELVVSVQTEQWDSQPEIRVETHLAVEECLTIDGAPMLAPVPTAGVSSWKHANERQQHVCLFRAAYGRPTCVVMIYPSDFYGAETTADEFGVTAVAFRLFARELEKGVILRSRLRCGFVDRHSDLSAARDAYRRFAESRPPLSA